MTHTFKAVDLLSQLANIPPDSALAAARITRDAATQHIQGSYLALFNADNDIDFSLPERLAVARQVAEWHEDHRLTAHYADRLAEQLRATAPSGSTAAPGHTGQPTIETKRQSVPALHGDTITPAERQLPSGRAGDSTASASKSARLQTALSHAERLSRHPSATTPAHLEELRRAGWSLDAIVTLSQLVSYVSFQSRLLRGYRLISGQSVENPLPLPVGAAAWRTVGVTHGGRLAPHAFTQRELGWEPWIVAKPLTEFTPQQQATLEHNGHAGSDYFRLLGRNLPVLEQRTLTDKGIFYTAGGLVRKERELAAAVASKINGCIYCASVHARKAAQLSKLPAEIQRLLDTPPGGILSTGQSPRWQAEIDFAAALSVTPAAAAPEHIARLRELGLSDLDLLDLVQATAFFAWANRLMLTLGEPFEEQTSEQ